MLRAIGHGCALIASDMPGRKELVEESVNGFLYPPNDSERLFQTLSVLLNSEETIKTFRMNNINISKTKYDGKSVINKFIYYYDKIVDK
jgi:glycosyltransferase involved in cell wall biosynthesis